MTNGAGMVPTPQLNPLTSRVCVALVPQVQ